MPSGLQNFSGAKRRKVQRTVINDSGEEVTEEVWEDTEQEPSQDAGPAPSEPS